MSDLCWWMDTGDPWEVTHFKTAEEAEQDHLHSAREACGYPWTLVGVLEMAYPAVTVQCTEPCISFLCPDCGGVTHDAIGGKLECGLC